ncbi:MAG: TIGR00159 family protein [Deltaproteobacteria bacterium]|nr:TIGR00159 family protein [Deltaproteobacteria bacterium]
MTTAALAISFPLPTFLRGLTLREFGLVALDILIVYYVVYRTLLLIKGTRAAQMLIGLLLIGAGFFASKQFDLMTVSWLLDNFINYFIIIIIVVFQQDIRRGLMRIGQNLFPGGRHYAETAVFEEVVRAAEALAKERVGALIVFERDADLAEFVSGGAVLDARVSKELLVAMFLPDRQNELHDGAIIIKNLRIQQAGALLPLSVNPRLDKVLGTRHRAAIGITEETDAVCVVVSEERGSISLCFYGNIARDLEPATLRKALLGLFQKEKRRRGADKRRDAIAEAESAAILEALPSPDNVIHAMPPVSKDSAAEDAGDGTPGAIPAAGTDEASRGSATSTTATGQHRAVRRQSTIGSGPPK